MSTIKFIALTQNQYAIVDAEDFDRINKKRWFIDSGVRSGYAKTNKPTRNGKRGHVMMHRFVLQTRSKKSVDHIDGDKLDNRKSNLRLCAHHLNMRNQKPRKRKSACAFKGVSFHKRIGKWAANITKEKYKKTHLGYFDTAEAAAKAYDLAAKITYGEFARLNF